MAPLIASLFPSCRGAVPAAAPARTLIFLDVDGVLNVGISDPSAAPMEFSTKNLERASAMWDRRDKLPLNMQHCLDRILATRSREVGGGENATYEKLVCSDKGFSDLLVGRLAKLITAAGEGCSVVLSSTWRLPRHEGRVRHLEEAIGAHLGRPFTFDDRTRLAEDRAAEGRLACLGDYAAEHCGAGRGPAHELKILVLEDFHISPLGGWSCEGRSIRCTKDVEQYLVSRVPAGVKVSAKLIHTFDQWTTDTGLRVRVGSGIGMGHFYDALTFLDAPGGQGPLPHLPGQGASPDSRFRRRRSSEPQLSESLAQFRMYLPKSSVVAPF